MKLIKVTKKSCKKVDADADSIISVCTKNANSAEQQLYKLAKMFNKDADAVIDFLNNGDAFGDHKYKYMRGSISEARFQCSQLLDVLTKYEDQIDRAYKSNIRSV